jgi:uncharacterized membrane protein YdjX (TVP38/TMEM64 family)
MSEAADNTGGTAAPNRARSLLRPMILALLLGGAVVAARLLDLGQRVGELREWIDGLGPAGFWVFIGIYVLGVVAAFPGIALTVAAGSLFGSVLGVVAVNIGSTVGAGLAFLLARYMARDSVERWLGARERFRRLDRLTERHGAIIVAITRLVPLFPFNVLNYGFGLTRVRFGTYLFWSWLCMIPGTVIYVVGADALTRGIAEGRVPWGLVIVMTVGIVTLAVLVRLARRRLKEPDGPIVAGSREG